MAENDDKTGAGAGQQQQQAAGGAAGAQGGAAASGAAGQQGAAAGLAEPAPIPYQRFKEVNDELAQLRDEKRKREELEQQAEEERKRKAGQLDEVIAERNKELAKLKPEADRAKRLDEKLKALLDAETKDWPQEVLDLIPETADAEARAEQIEKLRPVVAKLAGGADRKDNTPPGTGRKPDPKGAGGIPAEKQKEQALSTGRYSF